MILFPSPFLGFNSVYKGPARYIAMQRRLTVSGDHYVTNLAFHISGDGDEFTARGVKGDLAGYTRSGVGQPGAVFAQRIKQVGNFLWMCVRLVDIGNSIDLNNRAFLFRSPANDGETWSLVATGIEGEIGGSRYMADIAGNDDYIVALASSGHRAVSTDGGLTFSPYDDIGFTGTNPARALAATASGFVAGGASGQMRYVSDPRGSWTAATSQFGSDTIEHIIAGNRLVATGGNKISSAELNNLASWTARTSPASGSGQLNGFLAYGNSRWFAGGGINVWITSTDGASWTIPTNRPQTATGSAIAYDAVFDATVWRVVTTSGRLAKGDGTSAWAHVEDAKLSVIGTPIILRTAAS